jgi:hypothetical protein
MPTVSVTALAVSLMRLAAPVSRMAVSGMMQPGKEVTPASSAARRVLTTGLAARRSHPAALSVMKSVVLVIILHLVALNVRDGGLNFRMPKFY